MQYARGISYICPNRPTTGFGNVDIRSRIASVSSLVVSLLLRKLSSIHSWKKTFECPVKFWQKYVKALMVCSHVLLSIDKVVLVLHSGLIYAS